MILNFKEHTNALTVIYLFAFHTSNLSSNMYNACTVIYTLPCDVGPTLLTAFLYLYCIPNLYVIYLSLRLFSNIGIFSCLVFLFFVT